MSDPALPEILVPEIRDYHRINHEVVRLLESGHHRLRLTGVAGQRLLLAGLKGSWSATIEVDGTAGPDLASGLQAPDLTVLVLGSAGVGAGSDLRAGRLLILRDAAEAVGADQSGGLILVAEAAGHRAGLRQRGGALYLIGPVGRLAGDRRTGGLLALDATRARLPFGRGILHAPWIDLLSRPAALGLTPRDREALADSMGQAGLLTLMPAPLVALLMDTPANQAPPPPA